MMNYITICINCRHLFWNTLENTSDRTLMVVHTKALKSPLKSTKNTDVFSCIDIYGFFYIYIAFYSAEQIQANTSSVVRATDAFHIMKMFKVS